MNVIYLAKGTCHLGRTTKDASGNVIKDVPAHFKIDSSGGSVAVGFMDAERMVPESAVEGVYGDWDAAGYLSMVLQLLKPNRTINIPDLNGIVQRAYQENGAALVCDYCPSCNCINCIIREWMDEVE